MDKRIILSVWVLLVLLPGCGGPVPDRAIAFPISLELQNLALMESRIAVHPGVPGKTPFWNTHAERFIYAPAFDFPETESSGEYRFSILQQGSGDTLSFIAEKPWVPLSPVWDKVETGPVKLLVETLNNGQVIARSGEREFYRASPYRGPYHAKDMDYSESARRLFRYLYQAPYILYWETHGKPDPDYGLYGYPAKMFSAVVSGMLIFSELTDDPLEKETAIRIAVNAADYLIRISEPTDKPLQYFPPTYTGPIYADMKNEYRAESLADRMMLIYPAVAGQVYLDLFDATGNQKYFDAALRIAETYRKIQLENGTWHLLVYLEDGASVSGNFVVPTGVIGFLDRISEEYGHTGFSGCASRALAWMEENLVRDFNWEGQFEDQQPADRYKNLSKGQACSYALRLLDSADQDSSLVSEAEELIRFAEDQFVIWEDPLPGDYWGIKSEDWITPCVLEQYNFYTPVNTSSASMIEVYRKAYDKTGKILYLAKALDLANTLLHVQDPGSGHYPTYLVNNLLDQEGWINCMVYTARTILELDRYLNDISPGKALLLPLQ
jgi:maltose/maltodextrin transport system substrate-binding protein